MTKTFTVAEGKHYFKGLKFQELLYPVIMLAITLTLYLSPSVQSGFVWGGLGAVVLLYAFASWKLSDLEIQAKFSPDCLYILDTNFDQINKLYGLGEGKHHKDSARFGWRCVDGKNIEIMAYTYIGGERQSKKLMDCTAEEWLKLDLYLEKGKYVFIGENEDGEKAKVSMPRRTGFFFGRLFTYKLFPYFGGSVSAPHQMSIEVVEKEK
jgi:hypothetical protein